MEKKPLPADAKISPPVPPILMLTEQHVREAIQEWCWARNYNVAISGIVWQYDKIGDQYEPDTIFSGASVKLPLTN